MKQRLFLCALAVLLGLGLTFSLREWARAAAASAAPDIHCVNATGTGCGGACGGCYASIQAAINAASPGDEIRVAGGTYSRAGTVAVITKELTIVGAYDPAFTVSDPEHYQTVLDANWGGSVVSITNAGDVLLRRLIIAHGNGTGNCFSTQGCGGGIHVENTSLHVGGCEIIDNVGSRTGAGLGGGIYAHGSAVEMWNSRVVSNTAASASASAGFGGGIYVRYGPASLRENEILDNVGHSSGYGLGGGIYFGMVDSAEVLTNVIRGNKGSVGSKGVGAAGGLYIWDSSAVYVAGNRVENNTTASLTGYGSGGGLYINDSDVHLARNRIIGNSAAGGRAGGGVYIFGISPVTLGNNLIAHNSGGNEGGVNVWQISPSTARAYLVNNTIADNGGGGIRVEQYGAMTLRNNLIAGHGSGITVTDPASGTVSANTNLFWNTTDPITGVNGIRQDPRLTANYHLREGSPALNAGLTIPWLTVDLDGRPRPQDGVYDIGAYEGAAEAWEVFLPLVLRDL